MKFEIKKANTRTQTQTLTQTGTKQNHIQTATTTTTKSLRLESHGIQLLNIFSTFLLKCMSTHKILVLDVRPMTMNAFFVFFLFFDKCADSSCWTHNWNVNTALTLVQNALKHTHTYTHTRCTGRNCRQWQQILYYELWNVACILLNKFLIINHWCFVVCFPIYKYEINDKIRKYTQKLQ